MSETPSSEGSGPVSEPVVITTSKSKTRTTRQSTVTSNATLTSRQLDMAKKLEQSNTYDSLCKTREELASEKARALETRDELATQKARALDLEAQLELAKANLAEQLELAKSKYVSETQDLRAQLDAKKKETEELKLLLLMSEGLLWFLMVFLMVINHYNRQSSVLEILQHQPVTLSHPLSLRHRLQQ